MVEFLSSLPTNKTIHVTAIHLRSAVPKEHQRPNLLHRRAEVQPFVCSLPPYGIFACESRNILYGDLADVLIQDEAAVEFARRHQRRKT